MSEFFKGFLSREIVSLTVMLAVLLARLLFRRAPKRLTVLLWAVVCFRLLCPVSIDAPVSLVPKAAEQAASAVEDLPASDELAALRLRAGAQHIVNHNDRALTARQWGNLALELAPYVWLLGMAALARPPQRKVRSPSSVTSADIRRPVSALRACCAGSAPETCSTA